MATRSKKDQTRNSFCALWTRCWNPVRPGKWGTGPKRTKCAIVLVNLNKVVKPRQNGKIHVGPKKDQPYNTFGRFGNHVRTGKWMSGPKRTKCTIVLDVLSKVSKSRQTGKMVAMSKKDQMYNSFDGLNNVSKSRQNGKMHVRSKKDQTYNGFRHFEQGFRFTSERDNGWQVQQGPNIQWFRHFEHGFEITS